LADGGTVAYNQTWPVSVTLQSKGTIECLRVRRYDQNHPQRSDTSSDSGVGWGRYWTISATDGVGNPATGFTLTLTLPNSGLTEPKACRYPGGLGGAGGDCDDGTHITFTVNAVTRNGITSLSDWAVGNGVGPTAVTVEHVAASASPHGPGGSIGLLTLFAVLITGGVMWLKRR
jgi:hypothetical protein